MDKNNNEPRKPTRRNAIVRERAQQPPDTKDEMQARRPKIPKKSPQSENDTPQKKVRFDETAEVSDGTRKDTKTESNHNVIHKKIRRLGQDNNGNPREPKAENLQKQTAKMTNTREAGKTRTNE